MQQNISFPPHLSLWWGYIDETYKPWVLSELVQQAITKKGYDLLQYNDCLWLSELRTLWKHFLEERFWIQNIWEYEIMITNGATAGIDLVSRYILKQWKYNAIVLSPVYDTAFHILKQNSKNIISFPLNLSHTSDFQLIDWQQLEDAMWQHDTRLIYINPTFQNPTGIVFHQHVKEKLYTLSAKYWVTLLEDDPYKLYNFSNIDVWENMINLDSKKENVMYINSLSKVFFPWVRIWFLVWNEKNIQWISQLQKYSTSSPNLIMQWISIEALKSWEINNTIAHYMREIWEKSHIIFSELWKRWLLSKNSPIEFMNYTGGFYLWWTFKDGRNTQTVLQRAYKKGISFIPWNIYGNSQQYSDSLRISFAQISKEHIKEAIARFDACVKNII